MPGGSICGIGGGGKADKGGAGLSGEWGIPLMR
jgi:hypothetical protein